MTDLTKLRVSLTKHGAHKVYKLIEHFPSKEVLKNTWDKFEGIKIDKAQAARNLSALPDGDLPTIWSEAKTRSPETLKRLVFLAILFSHHQLIDAFAQSALGNARGKIRRGKILRGKAFTNIKNDLEELKLSRVSNVEFVEYDLKAIIEDPLLTDLAAKLFQMKLEEARWDSIGSLIDECIKLEFHSALSLSKLEFRRWLAGSSSLTPDKDELPEATDPDESIVASFNFVAGHKVRKTGSTKRKNTNKSIAAKLLHNEIQNTLFEILVSQYGANNVGTELDSAAFGTAVDLVVRTGEAYDFYEIKTSISVKKSLRQAIAQLIEYAYWPDKSRARRLIVVSEAQVTRDAKKYLSHLRDKLGLPIYYVSIDLTKKALSAVN